MVRSDRFVSTDDPLGTLVKYVQNPADFGVLEMPKASYRGRD